MPLRWSNAFRRRRSSTVEHPICNREVAGSSPFAGSREKTDGGLFGGQVRFPVSSFELGQLAEWLMAADCKSAALCATEVRILHCPPLMWNRKTDGVDTGHSGHGAKW